MKQKKKKTKLKLNLQVLQNGAPVANYSVPLTKNKKVNITADYKGDLSLPFYPIQSDLHVLKIEGGVVYLNIDKDWGGFYTTEGEFKTIEEHQDSDNEVPLSEGDYASIYTRDLRVLFVVEKEIEVKLDPKTKKAYRAKIGSQFFEDRLDVYTAAAAFCAGIVIVASFLGGLTMRSEDRPRVFDDLSDEYRIPFVNPKHILTAPEALQENIDRADYIGSAVSYYRAWTKLLMGYTMEETPYIFAYTKERYQSLRDEMEKEEQEKTRIQRMANKKSLVRQGNAVMYIPAVVGKSLNMELVTLIDKIELMHVAFEKNLARRRQVTDGYKTDEEVDIRNYRAFGINSARENLLKGVKVTKAPRNEQEMYLRAKVIGKNAELKQQSLYADDKSEENLERDNLQFVELPYGTSWVSFVGPDSLYSSDEKIDQILAKRFKRKVTKKKVREPLIGEINPELIRKSVEKYAFQLRLCYELALRRDGALGGDMQVRWIVSSRGKVEDVELVGSSIKDNNMAACVKRKIASWKFPRPRRGSIEVTHSFNFTPRKG